jgi:hypothetical protein
MPAIDRRPFLKTSAADGLAPAAASKTVFAQTPVALVRLPCLRPSVVPPRNP